MMKELYATIYPHIWVGNEQGEAVCMYCTAHRDLLHEVQMMKEYKKKVEAEKTPIIAIACTLSDDLELALDNRNNWLLSCKLKPLVRIEDPRKLIASLEYAYDRLKIHMPEKQDEVLP